MFNMFTGVTLPTADYDTMLTGFNAQNVHSGVDFHGGNSKYCAIAAHDNLVSVTGHNWNITDGGIDSNCPDPLDDFVITVKTDNTGDSTDLQFNIPTNSGLTYNYNVDCNNDGIDEITGATGDYLCNYANTSTYTVRIKDNTGSNNGFPHIYFNGAGDKDKIITLEQWGTNKWTSMSSAFEGTTNLTLPATDNPDLLIVTSMFEIFRNATSANPDTSNWDTSAVTIMSSMFSGAISANPDTSSWDTSSVITMYSMFRGATSANPDTGNWDTSSVTYMLSMFRDATSANPDTSNWNIENVTNMEYMFLGVTLPTADYDAMLIGFNAQNLQSGVIFGGGNSVYCSAAAIAAHNNLGSISGYSWTITDGGICDDIFADGFELVVTFKASAGFVEYDFNNLPNLSADEKPVLIAQGLDVDNNPIIEIHAKRFEDETHIRISFLYPEDKEEQQWTHEPWHVLENKGLTNIYWE